MPNELPRNGVSLLYALFHAPDRRIEGAVKFNKIIAKLYTEGLNKDVSLNLLQKGSAVQDAETCVMGIEDFAEKWEQCGMIRITRTPTQWGRDRIDCELTEQGRKFFEENGERIVEDSGLLTHDHARQIVASITPLTSNRASKQEHEEFLFDVADDEMSKLHYAVHDTLEALYREYAQHESTSKEFDIAGMIGVVKGINQRIIDIFYKKESWLKYGEQYLAHFYVMKHVRDFITLLQSREPAYESIERTYYLIRHVAVGSGIIHQSTSEDFEVEYFLEGEGPSSQLTP